MPSPRVDLPATAAAVMLFECCPEDGVSGYFAPAEGIYLERAAQW